MSFSLRPLYGAVAIRRPDIEGAKIQYAVQEAAKTVCRLTLLDRERLNYSVSAGVASFTITPSAGKNLLRATHVWWKDAGESSYSERTEADLWFLSTRPARNVPPIYWAQEDNRIYLAPGNQNGGDIIVEIATAPNNDASVGTDTSNLPETLAPAIVSWASSMVLMSPGTGADHAAAAAAREEALQIMGFQGAIRLKGDVNFPFAGVVPAPGGQGVTDYFYPSGGAGTPGAAPGTLASQIGFTPYGNIASTNVQAAIQELVDEAEQQKVVFGETMATNTPFKMSAGKAYKVTSLDVNPPVVHGVTLESGNANDSRFVAMGALQRYATPLAFGATGQVYLSQAGALTTTPPSSGAGDLWNVPVAFVDTTTTFVLNPRRPIRLS